MTYMTVLYSSKSIYIFESKKALTVGPEYNNRHDKIISNRFLLNKFCIEEVFDKLLSDPLIAKDLLLVLDNRKIEDDDCMYIYGSNELYTRKGILILHKSDLLNKEIYIKNKKGDLVLL